MNVKDRDLLLQAAGARAGLHSTNGPRCQRPRPAHPPHTDHRLLLGTRHPTAEGGAFSSLSFVFDLIL